MHQQRLELTIHSIQQTLSIHFALKKICQRTTQTPYALFKIDCFNFHIFTTTNPLLSREQKNPMTEQVPRASNPRGSSKEFWAPRLLKWNLNEAIKIVTSLQLGIVPEDREDLLVIVHGGISDFLLGCACVPASRGLVCKRVHERPPVFRVAMQAEGCILMHPWRGRPL